MGEEDDILICSHCGTEHQERPFTTAEVVECRDALSAKLASMTKRAEEAERENVDHVKVRTCAGCGGYLCPPLHCYACQKYKPDQMAIDLAKKCDAAEAKLATAVSDERAATIRYLRVWADSVRDNEAIDGQLQALVSTTHAANIESGEHIKRPAQDTLHALGIDPSKEQGK